MSVSEEKPLEKIPERMRRIIFTPEEIESIVMRIPDDKQREIMQKRLERVNEGLLKNLYISSIFPREFRLWLRESVPAFKYEGKPVLGVEEYINKIKDRIKQSKIECSRAGIKTWEQKGFVEEKHPPCEGHLCTITYPDKKSEKFRWYKCYIWGKDKEGKIVRKFTRYVTDIYPANSLKCLLHLFRKHEECFNRPPTVREQVIYIAQCSPRGTINSADVVFNIYRIGKEKGATIRTAETYIHELVNEGLLEYVGRRGIPPRLSTYRSAGKFERPIDFIFPEVKLRMKETFVEPLMWKETEMKWETGKPKYLEITCRDLRKMFEPRKGVPEVKVGIEMEEEEARRRYESMERKRMIEALQNAPLTVSIEILDQFPIEQVDFSGEIKERSPKRWWKLFNYLMRRHRRGIGRKRIEKAETEEAERRVIDLIEYLRRRLRELGLPEKITYRPREKRKGITVITEEEEEEREKRRREEREMGEEMRKEYMGLEY